MRKIILTTALFVFGIAAFSQQEEKNGTIYIKHAYIDVINNTVKAYLAKDEAANKLLYSDTARFWITGMPKSISIADAFKMWSSDFDFYDDVKVAVVGYPDYLHYLDGDAKIVQSWWKWSGKSKKTGLVITIDYVQFDDFNSAGKITRESIYGDFSKMIKE
ncbi:MAG: hypothetical protein JWP81_2728 [Ferruginibacter sp.]|nr:hypothetical protein [Ferruginibacter sp.]